MDPLAKAKVQPKFDNFRILQTSNFANFPNFPAGAAFASNLYTFLTVQYTRDCRFLFIVATEIILFFIVDYFSFLSVHFCALRSLQTRASLDLISQV